MFTFDVVRDERGVGFKITPKQSSRGYIIVIDFYVARYSYEAGFTADTDNAVYYDFKKCSFEFIVSDTQTVTNYNAYDTNNGGKSNIPLLDPNNTYNRFYSVAVQDVSTGVEKLLDEFLRVPSGANAAAKARAIEKLAASDAGFPASAKIEPGNLEYYLGADAEAKYNDRYQFLFADRDADRIVADYRTANALISGTYAAAVGGEIKNITASDIDTGLVLADITGGKTKEQQLDDLRAALVTDFDNRYGLFNVRLTLDGDGKLLLTFSYQVLTFEAKSNTGNILYTVAEGAKTATVSSYRTIENSDHVSANVKYTPYYADYSVGYKTDDGSFVGNFGAVNAVSDTIYANENIVTVYSTPTLRVNKGVGNNVYVSGDTFDVNYTDPIVVGESVEIKLSDYFQTLGNNIRFTYKNSVSPTQYAEFNKQFVDQTGYGKSPVVLSGDTLTVTPTKTIPLRPTVSVQRFADSTNTALFIPENFSANDPVYDEKITVNFVFANIIDFEFTRNETNNPDSVSHLITKSETFAILGKGSNPAIFNASAFADVSGNNLSNADKERLRGLINITGITTSEDSKELNNRLFTVSTSEDKKSFTVVPKSSGSGSLRFIATLYNKSLVFSVRVNIAAKTLVNDTITVVNDQRLYFDAIKTELEKANSYDNKPYITASDYRIITGDVAGAVYFTEDPRDDIDKAIERPSFIGSVEFEGVSSTDPNIRLRSSNSTADISKTYYMHVRFTSDQNAESYSALPSGTVIEAVYPVLSGKVRIATEIAIDVRSSTTGLIEGTKINKTVTGSGLDMTVAITAKDLLDQLGEEASDEYTIVIVKSDTETTEYFAYAKSDDSKSVIITPLDNTPKDDNGLPTSRELEVSVSRTYNNETKYMMITFTVSVNGILTRLPVMADDTAKFGYGNIWIYSALIVFGVLAIIFIIRFIVYFKKRAQQRAIIKRNQELIRMRDRMHNKGATATREQMVKTRLKMDDPKYAKMFREMKKSRTEENGGLVVDDDIAATQAKDKKKKKKKGGKKTVAELKAELEAKKAAFAAAQAQSAQPVDPFAGEVPVDGGSFDAVDAEFVNPDGGFVQPDEGFDAQNIDGGEIVFDATDLGDGE